MRIGGMSAAVLVLAMTGVASAAPAGGGAGLIEAVKRGDAKAVQALLAGRADAKVTEPDGATALHWAADRNRVDIADALIKAGAPVNAMNDYGVTPLLLAAQAGSGAMIERLVTAGAKVNAALPTGETALMTAARVGSVEAIRALLTHGADVRAAESVKGQTALMWASWQGHREAARALLDGGATLTEASQTGMTPLLFAVREGHLDLVRDFLDRGADINRPAKDGNTPLHMAVVRGQVALARLLLDRGADPNADASGFTPLHWVAGTWESIHSHDYIFNQTAVNTDKEWSTLSGIPNEKDKHDLIRLLIAKGAKVNAQVTKAPPRFGYTLFKGELIVGGTPFYLASITSDIPTMQLLLSLGADPKIKGKEGASALVVAAGLARVDSETRVPESRVVEAVTMLIGLGLDVNAADANGNAALHAATMAGLDEVVRVLAAKGANLQARNKKGESALKLAHGFEDKFLLYMRPSTAKVLESLGATE